MDLDAFQIISIVMGGLGALIALAWFTLRLYIGTEMFKLRIHIDQQFRLLSDVYETKAEAKLKHQEIDRRLGQLEKKARFS